MIYACDIIDVSGANKHALQCQKRIKRGHIIILSESVLRSLELEAENLGSNMRDYYQTGIPN